MSYTYEETLKWLFNQTPQFERIGAAAYKPGLQNIEALVAELGHPERQFKTIHVAGTNGKGSTSHTLAAILQSAGYKTGLFTSPHLVDFRERIRINGEMISETKVIEFVAQFRKMQPDINIKPSFFELTTAMAFEWFAKQEVDVAVIEVGLGGRLDSTNIINPELDIITNISKDHCAQLGNSLREITYEKSGIMRPGVTTICGEPSRKIRKMFNEEAEIHHSPIIFAQEEYSYLKFSDAKDEYLSLLNTPYGDLQFQLIGEYQKENARTILSAVDALKRQGWRIPTEAVKYGFSEVCTRTGLAGRWMKITDKPLTVCDTGHNIGGWQWLSHQISSLPRPLTIIIGFANDKEISEILPLLPSDAKYITTQANIPRAKKATLLADELIAFGLNAVAIGNVEEAYLSARENTDPSGAIFIGGSTYVVADLLRKL